MATQNLWWSKSSANMKVHATIKLPQETRKKLNKQLYLEQLEMKDKPPKVNRRK